MTSRSKSIVPLALVVVLSVLVLLPQLSYASEGQWVKYSGNPVVSPTPMVLTTSAGSWDSAYVVSPRVLYDGALYRMWFNGGNMSGFTGIGYATSSNGVAWTEHSGPVLVPSRYGAWDSASVEVGSVLWNGTLFLMWYRGTNSTTNQEGAIGLAHSKDGVTWTKSSRNPVLTASDTDHGYIASPYVIKTELTYTMWYVGRNASSTKPSPYSSILYATSYDGIKWMKALSPVFTPSSDPSAWDSGAVYSPSVYFNGTAFGLWYSGLGQQFTVPRIGLATSPDGKTWVRSSLNPILNPGADGSWDSAGVEQPNVVVGPSGYFLFYDGLSQNEGGRIVLAQAPQSPQVVPIPEFPYLTVLLGVAICAALGVFRSQRKLNHA
jgi:predicted GH43/DUF377 family glycosyl hydrolase